MNLEQFWELNREDKDRFIPASFSFFVPCLILNTLGILFGIYLKYTCRSPFIFELLFQADASVRNAFVVQQNFLYSITNSFSHENRLSLNEMKAYIFGSILF